MTHDPNADPNAQNPTTQNPNTQALSEAGVSIWLDDLSRESLTSGKLAELIASRNVVGVTTNPTIFATALADGEAYAEQVRELSSSDVSEAIRQITATDVRDACDLFAPLYDSTHGYDGRVSIEVEPGLAHDTEATVAQAADLHRLVDRENVLIKIPATEAGLSAITQTIAAGISVNVTLIFSPTRYQQVINAYLDGLEQAAANGRDLKRIHSVASVFVSRIDSEVDQRLEKLGSDEALGLRGQSALANARVCHQLCVEAFATERWHELASQGARGQRLLWASTGVKNPDLPDTVYVTELVTDHVVNTMPEKTLQAFADHGRVQGDRVVGFADEAQDTVSQIESLGIDLDDVFATLEREGVDKFNKSWDDLVSTVHAAIDQASPNARG